jgi:hypothetical protein
VEAQGQRGQTRQITQVQDDLDFVAAGTHNTVFLVTPEGIILADPISTEFATWLKGELDRRLSVPVRYIIYFRADYDWTPLCDWITSIRAIETLDFDKAIGGHGRIGTKAELTMNREFLEDLSAAVEKGISEGKTLDELKQSVALDEAAYNKLQNYR